VYFPLLATGLMVEPTETETRENAR